MDRIRFVVVSSGQYHRTPGHFVLRRDNWNDYGYHTLFELAYNDNAGVVDIGQVKIASAGMGNDVRSGIKPRSRVALSKSFGALDDDAFSLGQDREYYENLNRLPGGIGALVLSALNDVALDEEMFEKHAEEDVLWTSLMRDLDRLTVENQFRRIANGNAILIPYRFSFTREPKRMHSSPFRIEFNVEPERHPPTNMHVIIGANGVGKSRLLRDFVASAIDASDSEAGSLRDETTQYVRGQQVFPFAGLVHVAFSAFESDNPIEPAEGAVTKIELVGLNAASGKSLEEQFLESLRRCRSGPRRGRWEKAMGLLSAADALFNDADVHSLLDDTRADATERFNSMSSGHKIVLLTMSRLVELVEERTLILLDEPETHLHPPLLSAMIRAISELAVGRNGVAIVATHSPVVLQEVPRSCVWVLRRSGDNLRVWQLDTESFGESASRLTSEVFKLSAGQTGYHQVLEQLLDSHGDSADSVLAALRGQLGSEGRFILNALAQGRSSNA